MGRLRFALRSEDASIPLRDGDNLVGRELGARVRVSSPTVSRHHARIVVAGGRATVEDLGSKNGTFVNGRRVEAPVVLTPGDRVRLGQSARELRFVLVAREGLEPDGGEALRGSHGSGIL
jgi:pSer/pThr/pTyr-binding forkhead associated (FHA) protein